MGDFIVLAVLAVALGFAIRSLWKKHKRGGCCGDCSSCKGCH